VDPAPETLQDGNTETGWSFILDYPRPPKGLHANDRAHWRVKAGAVADIRREVFAKTRALHLGVLEKIRVDVTWVVGDHRKRDEDGPDPFCKAIYDGIAANKGISAHLVDDDSPEFVEKPRLTIRYENGARAHFRVTITAVNA
jgi:hypothetical protein